MQDNRYEFKSLVGLVLGSTQPELSSNIQELLAQLIGSVSKNKGLTLLVLFLVQVSVLGVRKNGLPGQILVPGSWFLVNLV